MGCGSSSDQSGIREEQMDISLLPGWDPAKAWTIDIIIEGNDGEGNSNFLFQADIGEDGTIADRTIDATSKKSYLVLDNDMYDINCFAPDTEYDGKLSFTIYFGQNTPRGPTVVSGWMIKFVDLQPIQGTRNFSGTCGHNCDGSGTALKMRKVKLLRYGDLTPAEKSQYPDAKVDRSHYMPTNYNNFKEKTLLNLFGTSNVQ